MDVFLILSGLIYVVFYELFINLFESEYGECCVNVAGFIT